MKKADRNLSIEQLENDYWSEPEFDSHVVIASHSLRKKPLKELTAEDLRFLLGQEIGIKYIIPIAIELLQINPWICGDFFDGDLLLNLVRVDIDYWIYHTDEYYLLSEVITVIEQQTETFSNKILPKWKSIKL